jgi:hypothetical protein
MVQDDSITSEDRRYRDIVELFLACDCENALGWINFHQKISLHAGLNSMERQCHFFETTAHHAGFNNFTIHPKCW